MVFYAALAEQCRLQRASAGEPGRAAARRVVVMSEWESRFANGRMKHALVGSFLLLVQGCADAETAERVGQGASALSTAGQAVATFAASGPGPQKLGDRSSESGVAIDWVKPANQELRVILKHKRDFPSEVTLGVGLTAPDGSSVEYTLTQLVLAPASIETRTLDLRNLPLKSSARGTQVRLWVEYMGMGVGRDGKVEAATVRVLARPAYVLHDPRFESATVRDEAEEQLRFEAMSRDPGAPRPEVRGDAARNVLRPRADGTLVQGREIVGHASLQPAAEGDISADSAQGRLAPGGDLQ